MRSRIEYDYTDEQRDCMDDAEHDRRYHRCRCSSMSDDMCEWCDGSHDDCESDDE